MEEMLFSRRIKNISKFIEKYCALIVNFITRSPWIDF